MFPLLPCVNVYITLIANLEPFTSHSLTLRIGTLDVEDFSTLELLFILRFSPSELTRFSLINDVFCLPLESFNFSEENPSLVIGYFGVGLRN